MHFETLQPESELRQQKSGCPTDNRVAISGYLPKLFDVHNLPLIERTLIVTIKSGVSVGN